MYPDDNKLQLIEDRNIHTQPISNYNNKSLTSYNKIIEMMRNECKNKRSHILSFFSSQKQLLKSILSFGNTVNTLSTNPIKNRNNAKNKLKLYHYYQRYYNKYKLHANISSIDINHNLYCELSDSWITNNDVSTSLMTESDLLHLHYRLVNLFNYELKDRFSIIKH